MRWRALARVAPRPRLPRGGRGRFAFSGEGKNRTRQLEGFYFTNGSRRAGRRVSGADKVRGRVKATGPGCRTPDPVCCTAPRRITGQSVGSSPVAWGPLGRPGQRGASSYPYGVSSVRRAQGAPAIVGHRVASGEIPHAPGPGQGRSKDAAGSPLPTVKASTPLGGGARQSGGDRLTGAPQARSA